MTPDSPQPQPDSTPPSETSVRRKSVTRKSSEPRKRGTEAERPTNNIGAKSRKSAKNRQKPADKPKRPPHRPTKKTAEVVGRILDILSVGGTWAMAAAAGEISTDTLVRWRDSDAAFASACAQARARGSSELLDRIRQEAKNGDWRAASWLLERIAPNEYGRRVMVGGVPGSPISIEAEARAGEALRNNPAALRALHDAVAAAGVDAVTNGRTNGKVSSNGTH